MLKMENNAKIKKVIVNENELSLKEANEFITNIYNQQINYYKQKFIRLWENDHSINSAIKEQKISSLRKAKNDLYKKIREQLAENDKVVINTTLEVALEVQPCK